jgi:hypothetical protein
VPRSPNSDSIVDHHSVPSGDLIRGLIPPTLLTKPPISAQVVKTCRRHSLMKPNKFQTHQVGSPSLRCHLGRVFVHKPRCLHYTCDPEQVRGASILFLRVGRTALFIEPPRRSRFRLRDRVAHVRQHCKRDARGNCALHQVVHLVSPPRATYTVAMTML